MTVIATMAIQVRNVNCSSAMGEIHPIFLSVTVTDIALRVICATVTLDIREANAKTRCVMVSTLLIPAEFVQVEDHV